jgi:flavin-dependent dehydrogenase
MSTVAVIGSGPAGSTFAARMAQLGHAVVLFEREAFPRRRLGESLSPGVLPLLDVTGARAAVEAAGFRPVHAVDVCWDNGEETREDPAGKGMIVDRGLFDRLLLEWARALGVRVVQPATVHPLQRPGRRWIVEATSPQGPLTVEADFVVDARGRDGRARTRRWTGTRTLALHAYWRGPGLPDGPRIEAGEDAWYWGVPLPDGVYNTLVFVDARRLRRGVEATLTERFLDLLGRSKLMAGCNAAKIVAGPTAIDATSYIDEECASPTSLKIGDAAVALDPLSSSGVQKSIQGALSAAIVANTLLRRPELRDAALRFHRSGVEETSLRHRRWAAGHYGRVAAIGGGAFWQSRAAGAPADEAPLRRADTAAEILAAGGVMLSREAEFVDLPCIEGEFVALKQAVRHPALDGPLAFLGGREVATLLRRLPAGLTPPEIARSWSDCMPHGQAVAIAGWMLDRGLLVARKSAP